MKIGDVIDLWCARGEHHWSHVKRQGRSPGSCPEHPKTDEELKADQEAYRAHVEEVAAERISRLELMLRSRGTHIQQHYERTAQ